MIDQAVILAASFHKDQKDKAGEPYILHVLRVVMQMGTEELQTVAALHDIVEDTAMELDTLRPMFPGRVIDAVEAITKRNGEPYGDYIERVSRNPLALRVKLADLHDNMNLSRLPSITPKDIARYEKYSVATMRLLGADAAKESA